MTKIKRYAFAFNHKINCIVIKGNVKSLPEGCFVGSSLKKITLPKQMKRLEKECLASCFKLRKIDLPDSLAYIGKEAFAHCGFK